ncbi:MAG: glycosyltransferase family 1 protein [candidate division WOR-3 bacterium]
MTVKPVRIGVEVGFIGDARAGVARYTWNLLREMLQLTSGVEFRFYSPRPVEIPLSPGGWQQCTEPELARLPLGLWTQWALPRVLFRDRVDVFWGQGYTMPGRFCWPRRRVLTVHDLTAAVCPETMETRTRLTYSLLLSRAVRNADVVVAVSHATARLLHLVLGVPEDKLRVVYEGVDPALLVSSSQEPVVVAKTRFGLSPGFILSVGTIEPRKDYVTLLRAHDRLPRNCLLVIAGAEGWNCQHIMREIRMRESTGRVRFLGRVEDEELRALYGAARVMVYPSRYEGFGLPVVEAMACGCPVVCSWTSSLPEVAGSAAEYFEPGNVEELADKLARLLVDDKRLSVMATMGRERAGGFSFRRAAREMLEIFGIDSVAEARVQSKDLAI